MDWVDTGFRFAHYEDKSIDELITALQNIKEKYKGKELRIYNDFDGVWYYLIIQVYAEAE